MRMRAEDIIKTAKTLRPDLPAPLVEAFGEEAGRHPFLNAMGQVEYTLRESRSAAQQLQAAATPDDPDSGCSIEFIAVDRLPPLESLPARGPRSGQRVTPALGDGEGMTGAEAPPTMVQQLRTANRQST